MNWNVLGEVLQPALMARRMGHRVNAPELGMIHATASAIRKHRTKLHDTLVIDEILKTTRKGASGLALKAQVLGQFITLVRDEIERRGDEPFDLSSTKIVAAATEKTGEPMTTPEKPTTKNLSVLFMDLSGWSSLTLLQIARYVKDGFPAIDGIIKKHDPTIINTWGDAIVAAFDSVRTAAECALDIKQFFGRADWEHGIPEGVQPRIALNIGEMLIAYNPVIEKKDLFGDAVHLAARLEPVTEKGQIFCTERFAKDLDAIKGLGAKAHYVEEVVLPKGYGRIPVYIVLGQGEKPPEPKTPPTTEGGEPTPTKSVGAPVGTLSNPRVISNTNAIKREPKLPGVSARPGFR